MRTYKYPDAVTVKKSKNLGYIEESKSLSNNYQPLGMIIMIKPNDH